LIEQDPGPRGSPHMPHAPVGVADRSDDDPLALTAKTDNCFSSSALAQRGHCGITPSRVRNSK